MTMTIDYNYCWPWRFSPCRSITCWVLNKHRRQEIFTFLWKCLLTGIKKKKKRSYISENIAASLQPILQTSLLKILHKAFGTFSSFNLGHSYTRHAAFYYSLSDKPEERGKATTWMREKKEQWNTPDFQCINIKQYLANLSRDDSKM